MRRSWVLRRARAHAHPAVAVRGREVVCSGGIDELGGGRSSGVNGIDDTARGGTSGLHLHVLRELTNPTEARMGPFGHRSLIGDELVRRRHTGLAVIGVTARNRPWGEGEMTAGLTGIRTAPSLSSGRDWAMQTDGRSPAADAAVTSSEASSQGVRRCLAWWGGRGCRDGAPGLLKGTREGPWPRWCKSAAAGAFGDEREEEQRRGMSSVGEGRGT